MSDIALVTSVPDLHTARILASAGVSYISFHQQVKDLTEIKSWLEGPEIGVQIDDHEMILPQVDFFIIKDTDFNLYSISDKKIFWKTSDPHWSLPHGAIYDSVVVPLHSQQVVTFKKYSGSGDEEELYWIDYIDDDVLFEQLFLS